MEKYRKLNGYISVGFICLLLLDVYIVSSGLMFGVTSSKEFYFQGVMLLLSIWVVFNVLINNIKHISINLCDILIVCFSIWCIARSFVFSDIVYIVSLLLLYFTIKHMSNRLGLHSRKKINFIVIFVIFSALIQVLIGLFQLYGILPSYNDDFRITGTTSNPAMFSLYLAVLFPIIFSWYLSPDIIGKCSKGIKTVAFLTLAVIVVILISTLIRTAWIGILGGGMVVLLFYYHRQIRKIIGNISWLKKIIILCFTAGLLLTGGYRLYLLKAHSAYGRLFIWEVALDMLKENPVTGVGYNRFAAEYNDWQAKYFMAHPEQTEKTFVADNVQIAYNEFLQTAVETGIVGILLFMSIILFLTVRIARKFKEIGHRNDVTFFLLVSCFSSFTVILIMSFFSYPLHCMPVGIIFIILVGLLNSDVTLPDNDAKPLICFPIHMSNRFFVRAVFALSTLFVSVLITNNLKKINCYIGWRKAVWAYNNQHYEASGSIYKDLYPDMKDNGLFLLYYGTTLTAGGDCEHGRQLLDEARKYISDPVLYIKMGDCCRIEKKYSEAEQHYKYASAIIPGRLYPKYLLALLFEEQGKYCEALEYARNVTDSDVKIHNAAVDEMKEKMALLSKKYICDK
jgi:O-antigen ligase